MIDRINKHGNMKMTHKNVHVVRELEVRWHEFLDLRETMVLE
jgi:hypothetical protein